MPKGGKLFIRLHKGMMDSRDAIEIQVQDNGNGIPAEIRSKIFDPFFTTKDIGKGTGLGLSLVYEIMQKHQGDIRVESCEGQGALFHLVFPLNGYEEQSLEKKSQAA